jgi:hypothetical protein
MAAVDGLLANKVSSLSASIIFAALRHKIFLRFKIRKSYTGAD